MTSQQSVALIRKLGFVIGVLGLLFDMLSMGIYTARHWQMSGHLVQEFNVCTVVPKLSGSITEARRAELKLEWSTRLSRELKTKRGHLTHTFLSLLIKLLVLFTIPMYTGSVECYTLAHGYSSVSTQWELSDEYQHESH